MYHSSDGGSKLSLLGGSLNSRSKRSYGKRQWNEKKRAGMSFLIVIVFFTVFALIILTEVFMIDEKNKSQGFSGGGGVGNGLRHSGYNRFGESVPDYDEVKDEYSIEDAVFMRSRFRGKPRSKFQYICFFPHAFLIHICAVLSPNVLMLKRNNVNSLKSYFMLSICLFFASLLQAPT